MIYQILNWDRKAIHANGGMILRGRGLENGLENEILLVEITIQGEVNFLIAGCAAFDHQDDGIDHWLVEGIKIFGNEGGFFPFG